jgi:hypothetical protein
VANIFFIFLFVVLLVVLADTLFRMLHYSPILPCFQPCPAAFPGSLARQPSWAALPGSLARQPCPAALPGSLARQPCPQVTRF